MPVCMTFWSSITRYVFKEFFFINGKFCFIYRNFIPFKFPSVRSMVYFNIYLYVIIRGLPFCGLLEDLVDTPKRQTRTGAVNFATAVAARRCVTIMKNEHAPSHWVTNKDKMAVKVIELYDITPLRIIRNIRDFLLSIIITTIIIITIFYTQFSVCLCNNTSIYSYA